MRNNACSGNMPESPFTDVKTASDYLGVSTRYMYELCKNGTVKAVKICGVWRINRASLLALANPEPMLG